MLEFTGKINLKGFLLRRHQWENKIRNQNVKSPWMPLEDQCRPNVRDKLINGYSYEPGECLRWWRVRRASLGGGAAGSKARASPRRVGVRAWGGGARLRGPCVAAARAACFPPPPLAQLPTSSNAQRLLTGWRCSPQLQRCRPQPFELLTF